MQIRGAEALQVPVVVTEQYPQALGHTVVELRGALPNNALVVAKTAFTMLGARCKALAVMERLEPLQALKHTLKHLLGCSARGSKSLGQASQGEAGQCYTPGLCPRPPVTALRKKSSDTMNRPLLYVSVLRLTVRFSASGHSLRNRGACMCLSDGS